jgi:HEPN domain-containing protein
MTKQRGVKAVDRSKFREYQRVAQHFYDAAKDSIDLEYWTAAAVLIVHAAIAYADALCIKVSGQRSVGESHEHTVALLEEHVAGGDEKTKALNQLRYIIEEKTRVSYLGEILTPSTTKELWKRLERFREWATSILSR